MTLSRRSMLKLGVVAAAAAAPATRGLAQKRPALVIYDSRLPDSIAFAKAQGVRAIDIAREHGTLWRSLRAPLPDGRIIGMTRWSDLVLVRGAFEEKGKRIKHQSQATPHSPFVWEMA